MKLKQTFKELKLADEIFYKVRVGSRTVLINQIRIRKINSNPDTKNPGWDSSGKQGCSRIPIGLGEGGGYRIFTYRGQ